MKKRKRPPKELDLRQAIRDSDDHKIVPVPTPEWPKVDGKVFVTSMNANEYIKYSEAIDTKGEAIVSDLVRLVVRAVCNSKGKPIFAAEDAKWLAAEKNGAVIMRLAMAAQKASGMSAAAIEGAEKNLEKTLS